MNEIDRAFIKKWLMSGEIKKLAKESGLKPDAAYKRLRGDVLDPGFVKKCYDVALERALMVCIVSRKGNGSQ